MARASECALVFVVVVGLLFTSSHQADINDLYPTNFNYTERTSRSVRLSWEHPKSANGTRTGYRVRLFSPPNDPWIANYRTGPNSTNITVSCLAPNTSYKFALCIEIDDKRDLCEKFMPNFIIETVLDEVFHSVSEEGISFASVAANWRAVLLGFGFTMICVLILAEPSSLVANATHDGERSRHKSKTTLS
ncbi:uncharacterized protein LOC112567540 [Pomacea canaliculata]|uniref:uncharacterized protein LOC112567540 n=1 Tax=Pomacea canaliculata TaxID=400727 RepID=UPI000D72B655|nr:uncharacterized protein LOC112567540 [Pomacea canaliculata]